MTCWVVDTNVLVDHLTEFGALAAAREAAGDTVIVPAHVCAELARILRARTSRGPFIKPIEDIVEAIGSHRIAPFTGDDAAALVRASERWFTTAEAFGSYKIRLALDASHHVLRHALLDRGEHALAAPTTWGAIVNAAREHLAQGTPRSGARRAPTQVDWLTLGMAEARSGRVVTDERGREFSVGPPTITWQSWSESPP